MTNGVFFLMLRVVTCIKSRGHHELSGFKLVAAESRVLSLWRRWSGSALGRRFYSCILGFTVPYSGSIRARVLDLEPGFSLVELRDRRALRNHLNCIHAIALANLGELASGLAMLSALPNNMKAIVVKFEIEYLKKARGRLLAEGHAEIPEMVTTPITQVVFSHVKDETGDVVAQLKVHWLLKLKET